MMQGRFAAIILVGNDLSQRSKVVGTAQQKYPLSVA
jgi:hypothetical protein